MQLGLITPVKYLKDFATKSTYHLVLAHMVEKNEEYRKFYYGRSELGDYITLDNSSYELGDDVYTPKQLIEFGEAVGATEIMAPETYADAQSTIDKVEHFISQMRINNSNLKIFATIHGSALTDAHRCFDAVTKMGVDTVGFSCRLYYSIPGYHELNFIPELDTWNRAIVRLYTLFSLKPLMFRLRKPLRYHLLGLNHPAELSYYEAIGLGNHIASCDSSCAYLNGVQCTFIDSLPYIKPINKIDFESDEVLNSTQYVNVIRNIDILKGYARDY